MDLSVEQRRLSKIKNIVKNPTVVATMLLPEKVFYGYNFTKKIYIKCKDMSGYFFVEKIENYKDGTTPVKVYLLYLD